MRRRFSTAMIALALTATTGCFAHFDVAATRASYAAPNSDPRYQQCAARVINAQESFNADGRWWTRSVVAGIVLGAALSITAIGAGRDTPGAGATTAAAAVDSERSFSRLEVTTGALAALAGADALLAWYSTAQMSVHARQVTDDLAHCPPPAPAPLARD